MNERVRYLAPIERTVSGYQLRCPLPEGFEADTSPGPEDIARGTWPGTLPAVYLCEWCLAPAPEDGAESQETELSHARNHVPDYALACGLCRIHGRVWGVLRTRPPKGHAAAIEQRAVHLDELRGRLQAQYAGSVPGEQLPEADIAPRGPDV
jgi:hypothetical protein